MLQRIPTEYVLHLKMIVEQKPMQYLPRVKPPVIMDEEQDYFIVANFGMFFPKDQEEYEQARKRAGSDCQVHLVSIYQKEQKEELLKAIEKRLGEDQKMLAQRMEEARENERLVRQKLDVISKPSAGRPDSKPDAGDGR